MACMTTFLTELFDHSLSNLSFFLHAMTFSIFFVELDCFEFFLGIVQLQFKPFLRPSSNFQLSPMLASITFAMTVSSLLVDLCAAALIPT